MCEGMGNKVFFLLQQNAGRIMRGLHEITLRRGWLVMAIRILTLCKVVEHQQWEFEHPLKQFGCLSEDIVDKLDAKKTTLDRLRDMGAEEVGEL